MLMDTEMPGMPDGQRGWPTIAVALADEAVIGMVFGAPSGKQAFDRSAAYPFYMTLDSLEAQASGLWMIRGLGVVGEWSGRGVEKLLLKHAEFLAQSAGVAGLATIIGQVGRGPELIAFFEAEGFTVRAKGDGAYSVGIGGTWVLLVRETVH